MANFSKETNRFNTYSYKWDVKNNELPMWVADMDFEIPEEIIACLHNRVDHRIFGYNMIPDTYAEAYKYWWGKRHNLHIENEWLMFVMGVVPAISSIVRKMSNIGDNVLILSPVYNIFYNSIINNFRTVLSSDLVYENNGYHIDFEDFEKKCADPKTTLLIFCNPHNPIGKIWDKETLCKVVEICKKHNVLVVSDEIHCDITKPGKEYVPILSIDLDNVIMLVSASKCFNMAGMQGAAIIVPNPEIRKRVNRGINTDEVAEPNSFVIDTTITAFTKCEYWIKELCKYVETNKECAYEFIEKEIPELKVIKGEATYLIWIDISKVSQDCIEFVNFLREKTGLYLSDGAEYGENGCTFVRMNLACPISRVKDGLNRLKTGVNLFLNK